MIAARLAEHDAHLAALADRLDRVEALLGPWLADQAAALDPRSHAQEPQDAPRTPRRAGDAPTATRRQPESEKPMNTLDLDSIPHLRDCHRVPIGAVIPAGTPYWRIPLIRSKGEPCAELWIRDADLAVDSYIVQVFTAEPIPAPAPAQTDLGDR